MKQQASSAGNGDEGRKDSGRMNFALGAKYLEIQQEARAFAAVIAPMAKAADEMSEIHPGILEALQQSTLTQLMVPAEFGGRFERLDPLAICVVREALMATSAHADSLFALQGMDPLPNSHLPDGV